MIIARQSTARTVTIGPVLDADGVAVTDGVVGDLKIAKNGGAPAALNGSATLTHRHTGHYSLALTASDLDTVGHAEVVMDDTVNACAPKELTVVEEAVYDELFAASALGYIANAPVNVAQFGGSNGTFSSGRPEVNTSHIGGTLQTANDVGADVNEILTDTGTTLQAELDGIQADTEDIQSRLPAALTGDGNIKADTLRIGGTLQTGNDVGADVDAILVDTAEIGAAGAGLTNINLPNQTMDIVGNITGNLSGSVGSVTGNVGGNVTGSVGSLATQAKADVNAEVDGAIETYHLDHLLAATYDPASKPGAADALLNELVESDSGVSRFTANALEQAPTGGSAPTAAEIVDEWESQSQADPTGFHVNVMEWQGAVPNPVDSGRVVAVVGAVQTAAISDDGFASDAFDKVRGADSDTLETLSDQLDTKASQSSVDDLPTNAELATALGTADDAVLAAIAALNNLSAAAVNAEVDQAISDAALATAANLAIVAGYLDTEIAAIKVKTDSLTFTQAGKVDANVQAVNDVNLQGTGVTGDRWRPV